MAFQGRRTPDRTIWPFYEIDVPLFDDEGRPACEIGPDARPSPRASCTPLEGRAFEHQRETSAAAQ